ncbi:MAG: hypothetical protein ABIK28_00565 [Planctomycetota bacterium]
MHQLYPTIRSDCYKSCKSLWWAVLLCLAVIPACTIEQLSLRWDAVMLAKEAGTTYKSTMEKYRTTESASPESSLIISEKDQVLLEEALMKADQSIDMYPLLPDLHLLAISIAGLIHDDEDICVRFEYALSLFPDLSLLREQYVTYLIMSKNMDEEALALLEEGLSREPSDPSLRMGYARLLAFSKMDPERARNVILQTLTMADLPQDFLIGSTEFSFMLASQKHYSEAAAILLSAAKRSPDGLRFGIAQAAGHGLSEAGLDLLRYTFESDDPPDSFFIYEAYLLFQLNRLEEVEQKLSRKDLIQAAEDMGEPEFPEMMRCFILLGRGSLKEGTERLFNLSKRYPLCLEALAKLIDLHKKQPAMVSKEMLMERLRDTIRLMEDSMLRQGLIQIYKEIKSCTEVPEKSDSEKSNPDNQ